VFIVSITYTSKLEVIDEYIEEHMQFLDEQYRLGNFILSGRKVPRTGGVILSCVKSSSELDNILALDPFYREKLAEYEVTQMVPSKSAPYLESLIEV